ncbi:MAG: S8 family serine peptidase, partial [Crocosphaera sp.]|nr:S8 family serine peptidase [Crocosphaera sp.]
SSFSQHHPDLTDAFAPGVSITAANRNGGTATLSGSSMAAPQVAGAVAIAQQLAEQELGRKLSLAEIRDLLSQGDDVVNQPDYTGKLLNVQKLGTAILDMAASQASSETTSNEEGGALQGSLVGDTMTMAEIGQITNLNHESQTILFEHNFENPLIFAQPLSYNGSDPSTIRITDIQGDRFSAQVQETTLINGQSHNGWHTTETFSFLVVEEGVWELSDGTIIEVGRINTNAITTEAWATVNFEYDFAETPVVLTQVQTDNDPTFVRTRQNNITNHGFEVALEEEEAYKSSGHGLETIAWLAISPGQGSWDGNDFMAGNTGDQVTHDWHTIDFGNIFDNAPKLLGNIATFDGPDPAGLRYQNLTNGNVQIMIEEDTSQDSETNHITENITFLAIEAAGTLSGTRVDPLTGASDSQLASVNSDVFTLGNSMESFYDNHGQEDYLEIADFDVNHDRIQLHGSIAHYYLGASPFATNDQGIFLKVAGGEDELIGIVKDNNNLNLTSDNFTFV